MPTFEQLILNTNPTSDLVKRLYEKRRMMQSGDARHAEIRTALIVGGGGMRGVYSTGVTAALESLGLGEVFDNAIGISAGACAVAYLLAGQAAIGPSVYYDDLPNNQFINLLRRGSIMDISYLEDVFRNKKPLNQSAVRRSRTEFYIGLTERDSGKGIYLDVSKKSHLDIISVLMSSSAIPGIVHQQPAIDNMLYVDGTTGCNDAVEYAINTLGATDILVVLNYPPFAKQTLPFSERVLSRLVLRKHPKTLRQKQLKRLHKHDFNANKQYADNVTIGILCPKQDSLSAFSKNAQAIKRLALDAETQTKNIFDIA